MSETPRPFPPGDNMLLFFDTETAGLPRNYKAPVTDLPNWPRMVQLAWLLMDNNANEIASAEHIIRPEGFVIPAAAVRIHGISTQRALMEGIPIHDALTPLAAAVGSASTLVAHNVSFDEKILGAEFIRAGQRNPVESKSRKCTMKSAASFCRIPGPYGFKWPTLTELHRALFAEPFEDAHNAFADVRACARCFFELRRLGVMA